MAVTILEALRNAEFNLENCKRIGLVVLPLAQSQLHNAVVLLEKGYGVNEEVEPLLEAFGSVENVPDYSTLKLHQCKNGQKAPPAKTTLKVSFPPDWPF